MLSKYLAIKTVLFFDIKVVSIQTACVMRWGFYNIGTDNAQQDHAYANAKMAVQANPLFNSSFPPFASSFPPFASRRLFDPDSPSRPKSDPAPSFNQLITQGRIINKEGKIKKNMKGGRRHIENKECALVEIIKSIKKGGSNISPELSTYYEL